MNFMKFDDGCGRYGLKTNPRAVQDHYHLAKPPKELPVSFNVSPGNIMPVVVAGDDGKPKMEMMKWGFYLKPKNGPTRFLFNTRDDSAFKSNFWKSMVLKRRALVPVTGYFEWTKTTPKHKYYFQPKQTDLFSFAGIWSTWKDSNGEEMATYSIITTEPNKEAKTVHNRMPVILRKEEETSYLEPSRTSQEDIASFLHPLEDNGLVVSEVSNKTTAFAYDDEGLIAPLNSA
jgi:putative SOS response-associated peptidase YedK